MGDPRTRPEFETILASCRIRPSEYELIEGFYSDSLNDVAHLRLSGRKASVIYIDCDLYDSTVKVFDFIQPYVVNGSIISASTTSTITKAILNSVNNVRWHTLCGKKRT